MMVSDGITQQHCSLHASIDSNLTRPTFAVVDLMSDIALTLQCMLRWKQDPRAVGKNSPVLSTEIGL
jgi:hypothetical protein